jgi:hypothetical protein
MIKKLLMYIAALLLFGCATKHKHDAHVLQGIRVVANAPTRIVQAKPIITTGVDCLHADIPRHTKGKYKKNRDRIDTAIYCAHATGEIDSLSECAPVDTLPRAWLEIEK